MSLLMLEFILVFYVLKFGYGVEYLVIVIKGFSGVCVCVCDLKY